MHFMLEQYPKLFHKRYIHVMTFFLVIYLFSGLMTMNKLSTKKINTILKYFIGLC